MKRPIKLFPQAMVFRTNLELLVQEAIPLKKIWCVNMMDDAHAPKIVSGQLNLMKTYLKVSYRLSDLFWAQQNDRTTSYLKRFNRKPLDSFQWIF